MATREGKVIIQSGANVWPHELKTAEALATASYTVEFVRHGKKQRTQSADVLMQRCNNATSFPCAPSSLLLCGGLR